MNDRDSIDSVRALAPLGFGEAWGDPPWIGWALLGFALSFAVITYVVTHG